MDVNCADLPLATKDDENGVDKPQNPVVSDTILEKQRGGSSLRTHASSRVEKPC